jgi:copper ion binding protein
MQREKDNPMVKSVFKIEGMTCDHCVHAVQKAIFSVPGVKKAEISLKKEQAEVSYEGKLDASAILKAVEQEGYRATPLP